MEPIHTRQAARTGITKQKKPVLGLAIGCLVVFCIGFFGLAAIIAFEMGRFDEASQGGAGRPGDVVMPLMLIFLIGLPLSIVAVINLWSERGRFSLHSLLLTMTIVALLLGYFLYTTRR